MTVEGKKLKAKDEKKKAIKIGLQASAIVLACFNGTIALVYSSASIILGTDLFSECLCGILELEVHGFVLAILIGIGVYFYFLKLKPVVESIKPVVEGIKAFS